MKIKKTKMKKFFLMLGAVSLVIMGLSSSAFSYSFEMEVFSTYKTYTYNYGSKNGSFDAAQGAYLGTVYDGNDDVATLKDVFYTYLGWADPCITFYGKTEEEGGAWTNDGIWTPELQSGNDNAYISGTWQTYPSDPPADPSAIDFIIVKGGNNFSIHQYDPAASSGVWNIGYLPNAGQSDSPATLSHISAYNMCSTPVPEPSTIILLGLGLLGLVGGSKLRKKS